MVSWIIFDKITSPVNKSAKLVWQETSLSTLALDVVTQSNGWPFSGPGWRAGGVGHCWKPEGLWEA